LAWTDRPTAPFILDVQLSADDYRRFFAILGNRLSTRLNTLMFAVAFFAAIAIAFLFRALASLETSNSAAIELVGRYSLFVYLVGVVAILLLESVMRRRTLRSTLASTPYAFDPKTVVIAANAVSITGMLSEVRWTWPAISQHTMTRGLLCLWIGSQTAVIIPERTFPTEETKKSAIAFIAEKIAATKPAT
jgi:hypothetical protein